MNDLSNAKPMAKALRKALAEREIPVSHSDSLELVSRQLGFANWNTLNAKLASEPDGLLVMPRNWTLTSNTNQQFYRFGLDPDMGGAAMLASKADAPPVRTGEFAAFMQSVSAERYLGQKIQLTGTIRTENADSATIWMRVDHATGSVMRFDNLGGRQENGALSGTHGWTDRHIVLDVPENAASVHYGFLLQNNGQMWARGFELAVVDASVPVTARDAGHLSEPRNLDFAKLR